MSAALNISFEGLNVSRTLGVVIREWKSRTGKSVDDLAAIIGAKPRTVYDWQADRVLPQSEFHPALMSTLGLSAYELHMAIDASDATRQGIQLDRDEGKAAPGSLVQEWTRAVQTDPELSLLARAVLLLFPSWLEGSDREAFVSPADLMRLPELTPDNFTEVWNEVLASGHIQPRSGSSRVFLLVDPH